MAEKTKTTWAVDANHSEVRFTVKHLAISNVSGTFKVFSGVVKTDGEEFNGAEVKMEIDTDSIDTNNAERDGHLKSETFLNSQKFPKIFLEGVLKKQNEAFGFEGSLTVLQIKKAFTMKAEFTGVGKGRFGDSRAGFEVTGKMNRKDFGLSFGLLTEAGSLVVGEEVKLHGNIQLIKQAE